MLARIWIQALALALLANLPQAQSWTGAAQGNVLNANTNRGGDVLVVDAAGAGDFLDLPPAVAAAADGDLILVRGSGTPYSGFQLSGKGLSVVAEGSGPHTIDGRILIGPLGVEQFFGLRGFQLQLAAATGGVLEVSQSSGAVWIEDCLIWATGLLPAAGSPAAGSSDAVLVTDSDNVVFTRVYIDGSIGSAENDEPRVGIGVTRSVAAVFGSTVHGPPGAFALLSPTYPCGPGGGSGTILSRSQRGGTGARVEDGFLFAQASTLEGGLGGRGACCTSGSPIRCVLWSQFGGFGIEVLGASVAEVLDVALVGGAGGLPVLCAGGSPCHGVGPGFPSFGPVSSLSGSARDLEMPALFQGGSTGEVVVQGLAGETAYAVFSERASFTYWSFLLGVQLVDAPLGFVLLGELGVDGSLEKTLALPPLLPGLGAERRIVQGLFFADDGTAALGSGSLVHWIP